MSWWLWGVLGIVAVGAELATPAGFYLVGFGAGAFFVALLVAVGLDGPVWLEWLLFAVSSVAAVLGLRTAFGAQGQPDTRRDLADLVGDEVLLSAEIPAGDYGAVELRGTVWRARNIGPSALAAGTRARVQSVEGVTLNVRA